MTTSKILLTSSLLGLAYTSAALSADLGLKDSYAADSVAAVQSWAGFYIGGQIGGVVDGGRTVRVSGSGGGGGGGGGAGAGQVGGLGGGGARGGVNIDRSQDLITGLHGGYNWQRGATVFGVEADIDNVGDLNNYVGSVRARLGYGMDRTLIYGTAGVAFASYEGVRAVSLGAAGGGGAPGAGLPGGAGFPGGGALGVRLKGDDAVGFVGGGGVEYKISRNVSLGVEGLYYAFDNNNKATTGIESDVFAVRGRLTFLLNQAVGEGSFKDATYTAPVADWTGFYVGGHIGALYNLSENGIDGVGLTNGGAGSLGTGGGGNGGGGGSSANARFNKSGSVTGGVQVGYNVQRANWVFGVEGDISATDDARHDYLASVRGRLGYASGSYLVYGTAGVGFTSNQGFGAIFAANGAANGAGGVATAVKNDDDQVGFVVGGGVETKISDRTSLGLEGLYYNFDNSSSKASPAAVLGAPGGFAFFGDRNNDAVVVRSRLSIQVNSGPAPLK